jgi:uncharacterized protein YcfJ
VIPNAIKEHGCKRLTVIVGRRSLRWSGSRGMSKVLTLLGASVGGSIGWWLGARVGMMTAFVVSTVGTGVGLYAGRRVAALLLD